MRRRIVLVVGLGLDDDAADAVDKQARADECARRVGSHRGEIDAG